MQAARAMIETANPRASGVSQLANLDDKVAVFIVPLFDADFDSESITIVKQTVKRKWLATVVWHFRHWVNPPQ